MQMRAAQVAELSAASRRRKNKEGAWDALSVVLIAAWHGELTFASMTSEWIAPIPILSPVGAINPLRFGNSSGKSLVRDLRNKHEPVVMSLLHYLEAKNSRYAIAARAEVHDVQTSRVNSA